MPLSKKAMAKTVLCQPAQRHGQYHAATEAALSAKRHREGPIPPGLGTPVAPALAAVFESEHDPQVTRSVAVSFEDARVPGCNMLCYAPR